MTGADLRKLVTLLNNVAPYDLARQVYGRDERRRPADDDYLEEKAYAIQKDAVRWMSSLDEGNLDRLAALVNERKR